MISIVITKRIIPTQRETRFEIFSRTGPYMDPSHV